MFNTERGGQNFLILSEGGPDFFLARKGGPVFLPRSRGGGPEKIGDSSSQIDAPSS